MRVGPAWNGGTTTPSVSSAATAVGLPPSEPVLALTDVDVRYGERAILDHVSLAVAAGESVAIMGASGSGKSTLLSCILGLTGVRDGMIAVNGNRITRELSGRMARLRRESVGVVFQSGHLLPELSPLENVVIAGLLAGMTADAAHSRAAELLDGLGVPEGVRSVTEFSGGEQQRVAVARALINSPSLLLADEPTGSLDPASRDSVASALFSVPQTFGCALVVVTHDPVVADRAQRCYELRDGRLMGSASVDLGVVQ